MVVWFCAVGEVLSISEEPASLAALEESLGENSFCEGCKVPVPWQLSLEIRVVFERSWYLLLYTGNRYIIVPFNFS